MAWQLIRPMRGESSVRIFSPWRRYAREMKLLGFSYTLRMDGRQSLNTG